MTKDDVLYKEILKKLSLKYGKPVSVIKALVESQFEFAESKIKELDFTDIDKLPDMKTNFNFKYIATFYADEKIIKKINKVKDETENTNS